MFGFFQSIGIWELLFILLIVLIIFGPGKLPEVGKAIGKAMKSFREAQRDVESDIKGAMKEPEENVKKTESTNQKGS